MQNKRVLRSSIFTGNLMAVALLDFKSINPIFNLDHGLVGFEF